MLRNLFKRSETPILVGVIILFVLFSLLDPGSWLRARTLNNVLQFTAILGLIAIGEALLIICKEIDLSVGSVYGVVGIVFIGFEPALGVVGSFVLAMVIAAAIGLLNALLVIRGRLSSVIVTLGALFFYRGLIYITTGGNAPNFGQEARSHWFTQLLGANWFSVENAVIWLVIILVVFSLLLTRTRFGNHLLAVGGDEASARSRGIDVARVKTLAFVATSMLAGFASILTLADSPRTHVTLGSDLELEAIAAAVIGGVALTGGRGTVVGAVLGAFFLTSVRYEIIALGIPPSWYLSFVGVVLVVGVVLNITITRRVTGLST